MAVDPVFATQTYNPAVKFANADGTDAKVVLFGNTAPVVARALLLSNLSANAYSFDIFLRKAAVDYQLARVEVPANAGHANGTPAVNVIDPDILPGLDSEPNTKLVLEASDQIVVQPVAALAAPDEVHVVAIAAKVV